MERGTESHPHRAHAVASRATRRSDNPRRMRSHPRSRDARSRVRDARHFARYLREVNTSGRANRAVCTPVDAMPPNGEMSGVDIAPERSLSVEQAVLR